MRIRAAVSAALASAGILLVGWQSGVHVADTRSAVAAAATGNQASGAGTTDSSGTASSGAAGAAAKAGGTYDGDVVQTRFGTVQVRITVKAGQITDVTALKLTDAEGRSAQISNYAAPILRSEVLQAQSADVQTVGGATVTSDAYLTSLQAALDAANL
ncbi:FMN-binding protein [Arthrobacter globiformis]|uniref:FMN-binding protein n=1 Tax=Arthrobacter globiformis TaxID=1665 RepID=UPI0027829F98|nr:FMN-binding protein [Arthrobacter globiformis]MDQ0862425.1 uncharacterized protein with FMN-binding domain [Arthrobacter globiformis]